jgi:hypothetical protein
MTLQFMNVPQAIYVHIDDRALSRSSSERRFSGRDIRRIARSATLPIRSKETVLLCSSRDARPRGMIFADVTSDLYVPHVVRVELVTLLRHRFALNSLSIRDCVRSVRVTRDFEICENSGVLPRLESRGPFRMAPGRERCDRGNCLGAKNPKIARNHWFRRGSQSIRARFGRDSGARPETEILRQTGGRGRVAMLTQRSESFGLAGRRSRKSASVDRSSLNVMVVLVEPALRPAPLRAPTFHG